MARFHSYPSYSQSEIDWLPQVPEHWQVVPLKASVQGCINGIWGDPPQNDESDLNCVRVADFDRVRFRVRNSDMTTRSVPPRQRSQRLLQPGDLLLEKSGGGERQPVGAVVQIDDQVPRPAVCSNFIARLPVNKDHDSRFLTYMHAALYAARVNARSIKQSTGIQNLDSGSYLAERVPKPPHFEQQTIADFLDRETAKIDALIDQKQRLIELLQEKRAALITQAVTKGLDPDVELMDTGMEWLGVIPRQWSISRLKFLSQFVTSGSRGWAQYYVDEGALFIRIGNLTSDGVDLDLKDRQAVDPPGGGETRRSRVQAGDLLVSITALIGGIGVIPNNLGEAYVNQHIALVRLRADAVNPRWLAYVLRSQVGQLQLQHELYGGTKDGLSLDDVRDVVVLLPPAEEQAEIVQYLDKRLVAVESLGEQIQAGIDLLHEYRTALISAAVTGKIDVREAAA